MAIIAVYERIQESGEHGPEGYNFDRTFLVKTDSNNHNSFEIINAAGIPRRGDLHPSGQAVCQSVGTDNDGDLVWTVTANYAPNQTGAGGGGEDDTTTFPTISVSLGGRTVYRNSEYFGRPLLNSAKQAFNADAVDMSTVIITVDAPDRAFGTLDLGEINRFRDAVHGPPVLMGFYEDPTPEGVLQAGFALFLGVFPAYTVKVKEVGFRSNNESKTSNVTRQDISLQFEVADSWLGSALDRGTMKLDTKGIFISPGRGGMTLSDEIGTPILDSNGVPISEPVPLDGEGGKLGSGRQPLYLVWQRYPNENLNNLLTACGLPTTMNGYRFTR